MLGHVGAVGAWRIHWLCAAPTFSSHVGAVGAKPVQEVSGLPIYENRGARFIPCSLPHRKQKDINKWTLSKSNHSTKNINLRVA